MGLRGAHARQPQRNVAKAAPSAWKRKRTRVHRVIAFLESLPITKGIYAGKKMKLLPGQRRFIEAVYGRVAADGRRQIRIAIKASREAMAKPVCWPASHWVTCSGRNARSAAKSTALLSTSCRPR